MITTIIFFLWTILIYLILKKIKNVYLFVAAFTNLYWISLFILSQLISGEADSPNIIVESFGAIRMMLAIALFPVCIINIVLLIVVIVRLNTKKHTKS